MAKFESPRYPELGFYVNGGFRKFSGGLYVTDEPADIAVLDALSDARRVDEGVPAPEPEVVPEDKPKQLAKGRKPSVK
ncbi:hypothetical protein [Paenibacillus sp. PAMC21692]|uniref:hypothetical protein n=1 Tax=Paenibacillus sp. PAMC21692 TaxID=2762320 RepID=UPI00164DE31B|nr:hypothetical protein [Paenibacillus sp. PAMC21692]QNK54560.1 hypothetical protein H7F31_18035 [Paenibacillus sp. PAMC21692]